MDTSNIECPVCYNKTSIDNNEQYYECEHRICKLCNERWAVECTTRVETCPVCRCAAKKKTIVYDVYGKLCTTYNNITYPVTIKRQSGFRVYNSIVVTIPDQLGFAFCFLQYGLEYAQQKYNYRACYKTLELENHQLNIRQCIEKYLKGW